MATIGLTAGDLSGIGPEILTGAIKYIEAYPEILCGCGVTVIGDSMPRKPGSPHREASLAALAALEEAAQRSLSGELAAVVTGPVSKYYLHQEGFPFPGQTEFFAARAGVENFAMLLTGGKLTVALVTAHLPLAKAVATLRSEEIIRVGHLLIDFVKRRGIKNPRIAVAGLNPHAGEGGDLGDEESRLIAPALVSLTKAHPQAIIVGPMSPDTIFWRAINGEFDAVLCMYHDQGLIPLKLHAFHEGVNVTLGLPFIRTSPDHGTAYDLAGKGKASCESYVAAIRLAAQLFGQ
ncbi:MAG: 4-hydroxythreonine-4-phosphate dehydrogenase PdxA [Verrucomicrobia bacterium RIFCSPHIGHO2_12_FULL_41_10]|nr:MAG: 4-hydroxythreonine-4-phosphate dehydrogenase PdxA [Verrucomicrobia bacterium RIFCSPHIGHO2_12_FULL_41_10]